MSSPMGRTPYTWQEGTWNFQPSMQCHIITVQILGTDFPVLGLASDGIISLAGFPVFAIEKCGKTQGDG